MAAEFGALVAGGLGPTGELLVPLGTLDAEGAQAIFEEPARAARGGIDAVLIETMSDLSRPGGGRGRARRRTRRW